MTADDALARLERHRHWFTSDCMHLPAATIRGVLAGTSAQPLHLLLQMLVPVDAPDADLEQAWKRGLLAFRAIEATASWGSKIKRAKIRELAADPAILAAIQAAAAHRRVDRDWLAVLVADGSDASIDALIPHLRGDLEILEQLRTHAADVPALRALFAESETKLRARRAASPALELARAIGLGAVDVFWFHAALMSRELNRNGVPRYQGGVRIDSRSERWFDVHVSGVGETIDHLGTSFDDGRVARDTLGLGRCEPVELPAWIARAAVTLRIAWSGPDVSSGSKRAGVQRWLRGDGAARR